MHPSRSSVVRNLGERAEVVGRFAEVWRSLGDCHVPQGANEGEEGGFAGAVLAYEEGERSEFSDLLRPEAPEVLEYDAVHKPMLAEVLLAAQAPMPSISPRLLAAASPGVAGLDGLWLARVR